jgi:hypothetical protein
MNFASYYGIKPSLYDFPDAYISLAEKIWFIGKISDLGRPMGLCELEQLPNFPDNSLQNI